MTFKEYARLRSQFNRAIKKLERHVGNPNGLIDQVDDAAYEFIVALGNELVEKSRKGKATEPPQVLVRGGLNG